MAALIADTAHVDPRARLAADVEIGPYCVVGPRAVLGEGVHLIAHVCVLGRATLGAGTVVHPFVAIGRDGDSKGIEIGERTVLGEHAVLRAGARVGMGVVVPPGTIVDGEDSRT